MGILGTVMAALTSPLLPLVLGLMLGRMAESQLRISITLGHGTPAAFLDSPIAMFFIAISILSVAYSLYNMRKKAAK